MRPQENFFRYQPSTGRCVNFPYTGACRSVNQVSEYENVFSSYDECVAASTTPSSDYEFGQPPEFIINQIQGKPPVGPSPDYTYEEMPDYTVNQPQIIPSEENSPDYSYGQPPEYGANGPQDYGFEQPQDYSVDYNVPNTNSGIIVLDTVRKNLSIYAIKSSKFLMY